MKRSLNKQFNHVKTPYFNVRILAKLYYFLIKSQIIRNSSIAWTYHAKIWKSDLHIFAFVRGRGIAPPRLTTHAPQACLATITAPALFISKLK